MAIDTAEKRFSMIGFGQPVLKLMTPTGSVDAAQRYVAIDLYSGISLDTPVAPPVSAGDEKKFLQPILSSIFGGC